MTVFEEWLEAYDFDLQFSGKSYYDSDTGYQDVEGARFDEMKAAFDAGRASVEDPLKFYQFLNRERSCEE